MFGLQLRQTQGLLTSVLKLMGLDLAVPDHTTLSCRASKPSTQGKLYGDRIPQNGPIHVLIDSTGLQVYGAGLWLEEMYGAKFRRGWRKLHLALDADSRDIIAHVMTDQQAGDASQIELPLASSLQMVHIMAIRSMAPSPITVLRRCLFRRAPRRFKVRTATPSSQ